MTKSDFIRHIAATLGTNTTKAQTERTIDVAIAQISALLAQGDSVRLPGFGTLATRRLPARGGRDPRTGEAIKIAARTAVKFTPSSVLKSAVQPKPKSKASKAVAPAKAMKPKTKPKPKGKAKG